MNALINLYAVKIRKTKTDSGNSPAKIMRKFAAIALAPLRYEISKVVRVSFSEFSIKLVKFIRENAIRIY
jgi:hypothetical protein